MSVILVCLCVHHRCARITKLTLGFTPQMERPQPLSVLALPEDLARELELGEGADGEGGGTHTHAHTYTHKRVRFRSQRGRGPGHGGGECGANAGPGRRPQPSPTGPVMCRNWPVIDAWLPVVDPVIDP